MILYFRPEIVGLSTTHGNVIEDQVFHNTQRILNIAQRREVSIMINIYFFNIST